MNQKHVRWVAKQERRVNGSMINMSKDQMKGFISFMLAVSFFSVGWWSPIGLVAQIIAMIVATLLFLVGVAMVINDPDWDKE